MKWKWLAAFLIGLFVVAIGIYLILDPEINELNEAARAKLGGTYIKLSDGMTHYKLEGPQDAKVVVLVHGATIPIWTWDKQIPALTKTGFRVLSYDMFGRGYSDRPDGGHFISSHNFLSTVVFSQQDTTPPTYS